MGLVSSSETINRRTTGFNWLGVAWGVGKGDVVAVVWLRCGGGRGWCVLSHITGSVPSNAFEIIPESDRRKGLYYLVEMTGE